MRNPVLTILLLAILACLSTVIATGATYYRWVDADGVVHYSDKPAPGSKKIEVQTAVPISTSRAAALPSSAPSPATSPVAATSEKPYTRCEIVRPAPDQTLFNVQSVTVGVSVEPELRSGDSVVLLYDGNTSPDVPPGGTSFVLNSVVRGTHNVAAKILDLGKRTLCESSPVTFHVRQPSIHSPQSPLRPH